MGGSTKAVVAAVGAVVVAVAIVLAVLAAADDEGVEVRLGDDEFAMGNAEARAEEIADKDLPLAFADLVIGGERAIWVNHVGDDPQTGWFAFDAVVDGGDEPCIVDWDGGADRFSDCDGRTYPPDGTGLPQYPTRVDDDGNLYVDPSPAP
jgi:hypothetical protein